VAQSLEQLKQQNAKEEAEELALNPITETEVVTGENGDEYAEVLAADSSESESITDDMDDSDNEGTEEKEVELWMQDEEQTSTKNNDKDSFDSHDMAKLRRKLKAKNEESLDEIAQLKARIAAMEGGPPAQQAQPQATNQAIARPKLDDFDYDEDKFGEAMDQYYINMMSQNNQQGNQRAQQDQAQQNAQKAQQQKLDGHYEQVQDLIASKTLSPDMYQNSEVIVRKAFDSIAPGNGDVITENIIAHLASLGEGSAKVIVHLGRNPTNRNRLVNALVADPTGLQAMGILGELKATLTSAPSKKISSAPRPGSKIKGDETTSNGEGKLMRRYNEAHKRGDTQAAFNIKQEAKGAGIKTRNWS
tara:strand:- start:344 stop:1426 length:1083 start_codon:yes stop_codon:yes gene_type:complete